MNIILIGYMGSGKSAVGKKLSDVLSYEYIDLDEYIQHKESKSITEIFKGKSEIYFRKIESKFLGEVIDNHKNVVISLGGGTPCYGQNMNLIKNAKNASSVYLKTSVSNLFKRLVLEKEGRPLISHITDENELMEFIGKHLFERAPYYSQSDITVNTDHQSVDEVVESIILNLY
ncbi:shikimate kinase [Flavobacteriaceae bacterium LMO-SS05]